VQGKAGKLSFTSDAVGCHWSSRVLVGVDFDLAKISKIEVHPEFIELFRMGLKGGRWEEKEPGVFEIV
jgi:hypothetical protein